MRVKKFLFLATLTLALPAWVYGQTGTGGSGSASGIGSGQGTTAGQNTQVQFRYPVQIYRMDNVSQALNLTPDQINRLNQISQQLQTRYQNDVNRLSTLSSQDRQLRIAELQQRFGADFIGDARIIFNDQQFNRYRQIEMQFNNFGSLMTPDVRRRLNLTDDQVRRLQAEEAWSRGQLTSMERAGVTDRDAAGRAWTNYWTQVNDRTGQILTPEQVRTWRGLVGDPFTFQPIVTAPNDRTGASSGGTKPPSN